jgi:thiamine biosynthesis lipoprotein
MKPVLLQPRRVHPLKMLWVGGLLVLLFLVFTHRARNAGAIPPGGVRLDGLTMGTTYSIVLAHPAPSRAERLRLEQALNETMEGINNLMSVYMPDSEISRINRASAGEPLPLAPETARVLGFSLDLARASGRAFDPTIGPLVRAWGFGPGPASGPEGPGSDELRALQERIGAHRVRLDGRMLTKLADGLEFDLNAVAKGHGVDAVAKTLRDLGYERFMVEIGGEVVVRGLNPGGTRWRIGVDRPAPDALPGARLERVLHLTDCAIATSGDYRNHRTNPDGHRVSHLFDPRLGQPISREWSSVTVLASDCLTADGLATALYVLGPEEGLPWLARTYPDCEALFLIAGPDGAMDTRESPRFRARTAPPAEAAP